MVGINLLMTSVAHFVETSQLTCHANQVTGLYMMVNIGLNELNNWHDNMMNGEMGGTE